MIKKEQDRILRTGFTTGTCAAAASVAAWRVLKGEKNIENIDLLFPDGKMRVIEIAGCKVLINAVEAWVIKDAGDDVDITNRATIRVLLKHINIDEILSEDFVESYGKADIVIRGGKGVGLVTRKGLDVPPGKWAINPVPRQMILKNLIFSGIGDKQGVWLVKISIDKGVILARKTLNPVLGIQDGLSILGTSGIVIPCSNKAYIATIQVLLRGAIELGSNTAVLVTGGRTHKAVRNNFQELPEIAFIRMGDFIYESISYCGELGFDKVVVGCMYGKLVKYALAIKYTHAHVSVQSMTDIADLLKDMGLSGDLITLCLKCSSMREFIETLSDDRSMEILEKLALRALDTFLSWNHGLTYEIIVFDTSGCEKGRWQSVKRK